MNSTTLLRYNFRIQMSSNWWLLVFPVAASQLSVFWTVITQQRFTPVLPAFSAEMVSPLIAAFLSAHILSAEYRSRVGAILASKPVHLGRVVAMRLAVVMALVWTLGLLSLLAYYFWMQPYGLGVTILAGLGSTLFLALFSLTFATLFRNPLAGFGVAALWWALDIPPGPPVNPFMSLRSYSALLAAPLSPGSAMGQNWLAAKAVLLVAALILYVIHSRLVFKLGAPLTTRTRFRAVTAAAVLVVLYVSSGAASKAAFGYAHRGALDPDDGTWFRTQFAPFGPVPAAALFGPAFSRYVGEIPNTWSAPEGDADRLGDTALHRRQLREVVNKMSGSVWAPSAAELLARLEARGTKTGEETAKYYKVIVDRFGESPYLGLALRGIARAYADANNEPMARRAYEELLKRTPGGPTQAEALGYLVQSDRAHGNLPAAAEHARQWANNAPVQEKFNALETLAEILHAQGDSAGAKQAAQQALAAVREFQRAVRLDQLPGRETQHVKWKQDAQAVEVSARRF